MYCDGREKPSARPFRSLQALTSKEKPATWFHSIAARWIALQASAALRLFSRRPGCMDSQDRRKLQSIARYAKASLKCSDSNLVPCSLQTERYSMRKHFADSWISPK